MFIKKYILISIIISAIISNTYVILMNKQYNKLYKKMQEKSTIYGTIVDNGIEKEYVYAYNLRIKNNKYKNKKVIIHIKKDSHKLPQYGDYISLKGEYIEPSEQRNYKGFNYKSYLKTKETIGTIRVGELQVLEKNKIGFVRRFCNKIKQNIINNSNKLFEREKAGLLQGLLIGKKNQIEENTIEDFRNSNLSHVLATSGMHINYITLCIMYLLQKSKTPKKISYVIVILILFLFMIITNFSSSVIRATIMITMVLISKIIYRKVNLMNNISISILITLIYNPFLIKDIGLQLSYAGAIGIIIFYENTVLKLNRYLKDNIPQNIINALSISISAQIAILPIIVVSFNIVSISFIISTLIAIPIVEIAVIYGFLNIIISFISMNIAKIFSIFLNIILQLLLFISNLISKIEILNQTVITPSILLIVLYYIFVFIDNYLFTLNNLKQSQLKKFEKSFLKTVKLKKYLAIVIILLILIIFTYNKFPKTLKVYFIDVGQGDSTLIVTKYNKKVLIDGGDNQNNVLVPYLLNRKINQLDYVLISHFDSDHCNGLIEVLERIKITNVIMSKQAQETEEFMNILKIIKDKNIKVLLLNENKKIYIDKETYLKILSPNEKKLKLDLNDNSMVVKLVYKEFSILFTGDISEKVEKELGATYKKELKSTVLKVGHHGSDTSSSQELLDSVEPKIALIGVGKSNMFGHPSNNVLERLKKIKAKIYRTDINGEIIISVEEDIKIKTMY